MNASSSSIAPARAGAALNASHQDAIDFLAARSGVAVISPWKYRVAIASTRLKIAEVVGQLCVVAFDQPLLGEIAVQSVGHFTHQEVAQHVGAESVLVETGSRTLPELLDIREPPKLSQP